MPSNTARERPYRAKAYAHENPRQDAVSSALTAQIIICVLILICSFGMKKLDAENYAGIKAQYAEMLSDSSQTGKALDWFGDPEGIFGAIFERATGYIKGKTKAPGLEERPPMPAADAEPEPEPDSEAYGGRGESVLVGYDYLDGLETQKMVSMGGLQPAAADTGGMMPPPSGSTLSPVYLGSKIKPPVTGLITSGFEYRFHPVTQKSDFHTGIDIAAEEGRPIVAALPGEVTEVGYSDIYGNYIVLQHAINLKTFYAHCSEIIAREGMSVRQGERIALVGETGVATGPHLHFSVIVEGEYTDPEWVLGNYIRPVE